MAHSPSLLQSARSANLYGAPAAACPLAADDDGLATEVFECRWSL